jgi:hypothetical protein
MISFVNRRLRDWIPRSSTFQSWCLIPLLALGVARGGSAQAPMTARTVPRFALGSSALALAGPARPGIYLGDEGRRAAVFGTETGGFEVWVWPVKLIRDLDLAFKVPEYDDPIAAATVARDVIARPEGFSIVYSHASFTVTEHVFVPLDEPGIIVLLEVQTVRPLDVQVRLHADFNLAWPGSFGGANISWQDDGKRFLLTQGGVRQYNAFLGSPYASGGTSHPAHDAPLLPSQFTLRFDTAQATREFIPIVVAGGAMARDSAERVYQRLLAGAEAYWRAKTGHYRALQQKQLALHSPDGALDLALEWAKVNLDQQLVCNPDLGCGLVAGFGRAGPGNFRPGFGWFFGGDAAINSLAMDGLGQLALVKQGLEFFAKYQRADGKITHEISQAAARLPWFTDYPYTFFHGDTTPFWILACYRYWLASGDDAFLRSLWPKIVLGFRWSAATDGDGDGLMENPLAGAGAIEVGGLGDNLLTDIYLAGVWVAALDGLRDMAGALAASDVQRDADTMFTRARARLESAFWLERAGIYAFALLQGVQTNDALTVWPATAMSFGLLEAARADRMLREIGSSKLTTDWGVRSLSREHRLYDPLHYNNGTVWGFVTGFAALAHYRYHRGWAGFDLVRDVARSGFDFARGRNPELMSGAFYRPLDTAVPQQFFATSMLVSPLVQGLLGLSADAPRRRVTVAPHLPADWDSARVTGFPIGTDALDVMFERGPGHYTVRLRRPAGDQPLELDVSPALPLGARVTGITVDGRAARFTPQQTSHDLHAPVRMSLRAAANVEIRFAGGAEIVSPDETVQVGSSSGALRVLDFRRDGNVYVVEVEGVPGREYELLVRSQAAPAAVQGAGPPQRRGALWALPLTVSGEGVQYRRQEVRFRDD